LGASIVWGFVDGWRVRLGRGARGGNSSDILSASYDWEV
jgi:hypothetical protein